MEAMLKRIEKQVSDLKCRECGGKAKYSKVLLNTMISFNDFGGDAGKRGTTQSRVGAARLQNCMKCMDCGHSWIS